MAHGSKQARIDEALSRATRALQHDAVFDAERIAHKAMMMAREASAFEQLATACDVIWSARQQRIAMAKETDEVVIVEEAITESTIVAPGCYLVEPPQVAADARRLRLAAISRDVPVLVLCREPMTQLKRWPIATITPGMTVRTQVDPPDDPACPDMAWFVDALESLGDAALMSIDAAIEPARRVDALLMRLDALPECADLHRALADACRASAEAADEPSLANSE